MSSTYEDILHLPYPRPSRRSRMSMADRAAQFSPFAALTGYDAAIQETGRLTQSEVQMDTDGVALLNEKLQQLQRTQAQRPQVVVTYFVPDDRKSGGAYVTAMGKVKRVDSHEKSLLLEDGTIICFNRIYEIESDVF